METIRVKYSERQNGKNRWIVHDTFGEVVGNHKKKDQAVEAARDFAKNRAMASGRETKLKIMNTNHNLDREHTYSP